MRRGTQKMTNEESSLDASGIILPVPDPPIGGEPHILTEVRMAISKLKYGKAATICDIPAEMLKSGGEPMRGREFSRRFLTAYIDLKNAFNSMHQESLWEILRLKGILTRIIGLMVSLHTSTESAVNDVAILSESLESLVPVLGAFSNKAMPLGLEGVDMTGVMAALHDRHALVDFSAPLWLDGKTIMYKRPVRGSDIAGFVKPFTPELWSLVMASTCLAFLVTGAVHLGQALGPGGDAKQERRRPGGGQLIREEVIDSANRSFLWTFSALLGQSVAHVPSSAPVRAFAGVWLVASLVVGAVYRSNLKAMLILPKFSLPFDSLAQFVETDIQLFTAKNALMDRAIQEAPPDSLLGRLKARKVAHQDLFRAFQDVKDGVLAGSGSMISGWHFLHTDFSLTGKCDTYMMSELMFQTTSQCLAFPKGSRLKAKVDRVIHGLKEFGILDHLLRRAIHNATECLKPLSAQADNSLRPLELGDFYGVFCIYLGGMVLCTFVFLAEKVIGSRSKRRLEDEVTGGQRGRRP
ncbi:glutamate [NMDA] receptor subunit 1-like [Penaeus indicus]|uniref:glutamate [NMDA] receptor subunit 1-like n=1 Tax=Penaeus indicus TaxID=29960 RepID=UPI00300CF38F